MNYRIIKHAGSSNYTLQRLNSKGNWTFDGHFGRFTHLAEAILNRSTTLDLELLAEDAELSEHLESLLKQWYELRDEIAENIRDFVVFEEGKNGKNTDN